MTELSVRHLSQGLFQRGSLLDNPGFRSFLLARLLAQTAQNAIFYALLILVVKETGRSIHSSLLLLCFILPSAAFGLFAGLAVDFLPRRLILVLANVLRGGIALGLAFSGESVWAIYGYSLLLATVNQFAAPAELATLPSLVEGSHLTAANSLANLALAGAQVLGVVVLTPLFLKTVGSDPLFLLAATLFVAAAVFLTTIPRRPGRGVVRRVDAYLPAAWRAQLEAAGKALLQEKAAWNAVVLLTLASTSILVVATVLPRYVQGELQLPVENAVFVFAPAALGVGAGLRLVAWLEQLASKNALTITGFGVLVGGLLILAFVGPLSDALARWNPLGLFEPGPLNPRIGRVLIVAWTALLLGFAFAVINVTARALLHERIPLEMQGRVFALQTVVTNVASVLPLLAAGILADWLGTAPVLVLVALAILGLAFYSGYQAERLRGSGT